MREFMNIIEGAYTFRVFHGTDADFKSFDRKSLGTAHGRAPINMMGFNFTDNPELAKTFGKNLISAEVTMNNPFFVDAEGKDYTDFKHELNELLDDVTPDHDGVIIKNYADGGRHAQHYIEGNHYIVFDPNDITITATTET